MGHEVLIIRDELKSVLDELKEMAGNTPDVYYSVEKLYQKYDAEAEAFLRDMDEQAKLSAAEDNDHVSYDPDSDLPF